MQAFRESQSILPPELTLPFRAWVAYEHLLTKIVDIDAFLNDNILG